MPVLQTFSTFALEITVMKSPSAVCAAVLAAALSGCVIAPPVVHPVNRPAYITPPGVVYIAPTYVLPAPGYVWQYHPNYGWGWRHPDNGWHRGWR